MSTNATRSEIQDFDVHPQTGTCPLNFARRHEHNAITPTHKVSNPSEQVEH
jgi:hypothetical protein